VKLRTVRPQAPELEDDEPAAGFSPSQIDRVMVEVVTTSGRGAAVEFRIRADTVELWHHEHLAAVLDRDVLSAWLREPTDDLDVDEARLSIDWLLDVHGRIALTLPDVNAWALSPTELDTLYRRVVQ
jgi:hypothetical protein